MTLWRRDWNGSRRPILRYLVASALAVFAFRSDQVLAQATTERVVINRVTGYAISGFDPVAYFAESQPLAGQNHYEWVYDHAIWRFRNEGNLNAFRQHPEVYEPLFGGYDPVTIANGKAVEGRPQIWAVIGSRLALFSSLENRRVLLDSPRSWLLEASHRWPTIRQELAQ
jgi:hypothetical protein